MLAERLIANLVDDTVRYNVAAGGIWISTRTTAGSSQLTVANAGPADSERIFQPFLVRHGHPAGVRGVGQQWHY